MVFSQNFQEKNDVSAHPDPLSNQIQVIGRPKNALLIKQIVKMSNVVKPNSNVPCPYRREGRGGGGGGVGGWVGV